MAIQNIKNLGDLEFKPEDFTPPYPFLVPVEMSKEEAMAHIANHFLRERLAKAPEMFGTYREGCLSSAWRVGTPFGGWSQTLDAHRARLVCIEEIK